MVDSERMAENVCSDQPNTCTHTRHQMLIRQINMYEVRAMYIQYRPAATLQIHEWNTRVTRGVRARDTRGTCMHVMTHTHTVTHTVVILLSYTVSFCLLRLTCNCRVQIVSCGQILCMYTCI